MDVTQFFEGLHRARDRGGQTLCFSQDAPLLPVDTSALTLRPSDSDQDLHQGPPFSGTGAQAEPHQWRPRSLACGGRVMGLLGLRTHEPAPVMNLPLWILTSVSPDVATALCDPQTYKV